jgi:hypothetical protein
MNFLAPLMLFGLLAVAIPPILHLLNRKEAKPVDFPAMEFLRRAYRKTARRLKMKQWLLLALRMSLFAFLALALSKPLWTPSVDSQGSNQRTMGEADGPHVIIFDQSYAMGYMIDEAEKRSLLDIARSHALRILSDTSGPAAIITIGESTESLTQSLTADHHLLEEGLKSLIVSEYVGDLGEALPNAYQLLKDRPRTESKYITILSTPNRDLNTVPSPPPQLGDVTINQVTLTTGLNLRDPSSGEVNAELPVISHKARIKLANHAITKLTLSPAPQMGHQQWRVEVEVANYSSEAMVLWPIWVEVEGEVLVRGFMSLGPHETGIKRLYFKGNVSAEEQEVSAEEKRPTVSAKRAWVKLAPDPLPIDDQWPFWIEARPPTNLLALNGDPRPTPHEDELFYLERALAPKVLGDTKVKIQSRLLMGTELKDEVLEGVDIILLANVPRPSFKLGQQLISHLNAGGGVWLAPGARSDVDAWNITLTKILPRPLRGMRRAGDAAAVEGRAVARLSDFNTDHSLLTPFEDPQRSSLALAKIQRYFLFDPKPVPQSDVIVKLNEGSPYILTRQVNAGRVVLFAGPLDREWNDLVIRPDFVPLAAETIRYLTREVASGRLFAPIGTTLALELNGEGPFFALSPQGERQTLSRVADRQTPQLLNQRGWEVTQLKRLGHHTITSAHETQQTSQSTEKVIRRFVVPLNVKGSRLNVHKPYVNKGGDDQAYLNTTGILEERRELWHFGLVGLFFFTLLEGLTLFQRRQTEQVNV